MVRGKRSIRLRQTLKFVRIQSTGNQFQGTSPATITLLAVHSGIVVSSYQWWSGSTTVGTNQNLIIANNQVLQVEVFKVKITTTDGQEYEDSVSITKVNNGQQGRPGAIPIQREWTTGNIHRNNPDVIDYIYHRPTNTWWRLKDGYNNITAPINPTNQYIQLNSFEQIAVQLIIAEEANLAGFVFRNQKLVSQNPSPQNPNLILDGVNGSINAKSGTIGEFEINTGLEYEKLTIPSPFTQNTALLKKFKFDKEGFIIRDRNIYRGVWCKEIDGIDYCVSGTRHIVDFQISTGDSSHYLRIKGEGTYSFENYKGALWVTAPSAQIPAILIDKGGLKIDNGSINLEKGNIRLREGNISGLAIKSSKLTMRNDHMVLTDEVYLTCDNNATLNINLPPAIEGRVVYVRLMTNHAVRVWKGNGPRINVKASFVDSIICKETAGDLSMFVCDGTNWFYNFIKG